MAEASMMEIWAAIAVLAASTAVWFAIRGARGSRSLGAEHVAEGT